MVKNGFQNVRFLLLCYKTNQYTIYTFSLHFWSLDTISNIFNHQPVNAYAKIYYDESVNFFTKREDLENRVERRKSRQYGECLSLSHILHH